MGLKFGHFFAHSEQHRLKVSEYGVLSVTVGAKSQDVACDWNRPCSEGFHNYTLTTNYGMLKLRSAREGSGNCIKIFGGNIRRSTTCKAWDTVRE
jgi:hypothetical protein